MSEPTTITMAIDEYDRLKLIRRAELDAAFADGELRGRASSYEIKTHNKELMAAIELHQKRDVRFFEVIELVKNKDTKKLLLNAYTGTALNPTEPQP